jgi:hypothetical protein
MTSIIGFTLKRVRTPISALKTSFLHTAATIRLTAKDGPTVQISMVANPLKAQLKESIIQTLAIQNLS